MSKIMEYIKNDHVQGSFVSGLCIIALALYFKKVEHMKEVPYLVAAVPGYLFTLWETAKEKFKDRIWGRVFLWNILMALSTGLIMLCYALT